VNGGKLSYESKSKNVKLDNIKLFKVESRFYDLVHYEIYHKTEQRRIDEILKKLFTKLGEKSWCLDLGCGTGNITQREATFFKNVVGLDISVKMFKKLREKIRSRGHVVCADCEHLPFQCDKIDFVSCYSSLHHLPNIQLALREAYRVLKLHGLLYVDHEPNGSQRALLLSYFYGIIASIGQKLIRKHSRFPILINFQREFSDADYHSSFSHSYLRKLLYSTGFSDVQITANTFISMLTSPLPLGDLLGNKVDNLLALSSAKDLGLYLTIIGRKRL